MHVHVHVYTSTCIYICKRYVGLLVSCVHLQEQCSENGSDGWNSQLMVQNIGSRNATLRWSQDASRSNATYIVLYRDVIGISIRSEPVSSIEVTVDSTPHHNVHVHVHVYACNNSRQGKEKNSKQISIFREKRAALRETLTPDQGSSVGWIQIQVMISNVKQLHVQCTCKPDKQVNSKLSM